MHRISFPLGFSSDQLTMFCLKKWEGCMLESEGCKRFNSMLFVKRINRKKIHDIF